MRILAAFLILISMPSSAMAQEYCAAIRGNGENVAAHWSGLSRLIEENGMPSKMAGGSSASVSMFFLNSIAGNRAVKNEIDPERKRKKQGLLVKSISEFVSQMSKTDEAMSAYALIHELSRKDSSLSNKLDRLAKGENGLSPAQLSAALQKFYPLLNPEIIRGLTNRPEFFQGEVRKAIEIFGKFDAVTDKNLFLRPGIVDFKEFAINLGNIADFYNGNTDEETRVELERYTEECADSAYQKTWGDIPNDGCKARFQRIASSYLKKGNFQNKALFEPVGSNIKSIPTTAVVKGEAVNRYNDLRTSYFQGETNRDYSKFTIDFERELKFGYFTSEGERIRAGLAPLAAKGDLKSQKFEALAPGNWFEVLATSPAEPGLASLQPIPMNTTREKVLAERAKPASQRWTGLQYRPGILSAGGWSDLHPTTVLKASGCKRVAYMTRKDGETIFGQQVFIRLTGAQEEVPFWERIGDKNNSGWPVTGPTERSPWHQLFNLANAESSFNTSLAAADITYCTDWNRYEPFKGQTVEMEQEAYNAPVFLKPGMPESFRVNRGASAPSASSYPGCISLRKAGGAEPASPTGATRPAL